FSPPAPPPLYTLSLHDALPIWQQALWTLGISGDWPILLATIESPVGMPSVRQLLRSHHYWRLKGIVCDLVILNVHPASYMQELRDRKSTRLNSSHLVISYAVFC